MPIKQPSKFTVSGLPPEIFGEVYVVISVWKPTETEWLAEYNLLNTYPKDKLDSRVVAFDVKIYPSDLKPIDEAYMEAEAVRQAQIDLELELEKRATSLNRTESAFFPIKLHEIKICPVTLWVRNLFPANFVDMANQTKSSDLKKYLQMVMGLQKLRAS